MDASDKVTSMVETIVTVMNGFSLELAAIEAQMKAISDLGMCCGKIEKRKNAGLVVHPAKSTCPYPTHTGESGRKGRGIRKWVKQDDVLEMLDCQSRYYEWLTLDNEMKRYRAAYNRLFNRLKSASDHAAYYL